MQIKPMSEQDQMKYYNIVQKQQDALISVMQMSPKDRKRKLQIEAQIKNQPKFQVPIPNKQLTDKTSTGLRPRIVGNGFNTADKVNNSKNQAREVFKNIKQQQELKEKIIEKEVQKRIQQRSNEQQNLSIDQQLEQQNYFQYVQKKQQYNCKKCGKDLNFLPLFDGDQPQNLLCNECIQSDMQQIMSSIVFQPQNTSFQQFDIQQLQKQINEKENTLIEQQQLQNSNNYSIQNNEQENISINEYKFEIEILKQQLQRLQQRYKNDIQKINLEEIEQIQKLQDAQTNNLYKKFPYIIQRTICPCCGEITSVKLINLQENQAQQQVQQQQQSTDKEKELKLLYLQHIDNQLQHLQDDESTVSQIQIEEEKSKNHQQNPDLQDNLSIITVNSV